MAFAHFPVWLRLHFGRRRCRGRGGGQQTVGKYVYFIFMFFHVYSSIFFFFQILIWQNNIQIWNFLKIVWHFCGNSWYFSNCFWHNTMDAFGDFFPKSIWDKLQQVTSQKNQDTIVITTLRIDIIKMLLLFLTFYSLEPKIEIRT